MPASLASDKAIVVFPPAPAVNCVIVTTPFCAVAINFEFAFKQVARLFAASVTLAPSWKVGLSLSSVVVVVAHAHHARGSVK